MPNPNTAWKNVQEAVQMKRLRKKAKSCRNPRRRPTTILEVDEEVMEDEDGYEEMQEEEEDNVSESTTASSRDKEPAPRRKERKAMTMPEGFWQLPVSAGRSVSLGDLPLLVEGRSVSLGDLPLLEIAPEEKKKPFESSAAQGRDFFARGRARATMRRRPLHIQSMGEVMSEHWSVANDNEESPEIWPGRPAFAEEAAIKVEDISSKDVPAHLSLIEALDVARPVFMNFWPDLADAIGNRD